MLDGGRNGGRVPFRGLNAPPRNAKVQTLNEIKKYPHTINANPF